MRTIALAATLTLTLGTAAQSPVKQPIGSRLAHSTGIAHKTVRHVAKFTKASLTVHSIGSTQLSSPRPHAPAKLAAAPAELIPAPFSQNPILQLRGNARALIVFAPDTRNVTYIDQLSLLERNELALSERDAILVPIVVHHHSSDEVLPGENVYSGTESDQLSARLKFGINPNDFAVILLDKDGTVQLRSTTPVTVASIGARIDRLTGPGE